VELENSRGYETPEHKAFMRFTVLIADFMSLIPAVILLLWKFYGTIREDLRVLFALLILNYPGFLLIDHGHFQYNCIMLGLTVLAAYFII